ncbi:type III-B CRISPR module RAMP protein Cmr4 [Thermococcus sp. 18S1]|uniref:type III-B CRISPR module RAMP protein Cmr4 n=1 Tax=Thermococcus sp. 18S1 TaxID=1638210 RepID=UPI0014391C42|nr:type III-B CRISPR module RAMP protein Cmr4 [Thermococcus sp. 18S1]NJE31239.1 type III-B CRISPR module RAMP protein Cmr4 [Thermococcus sp. 18S1]
MKSLVLGLYAITPLHPGSGSEISVIDLPIQRERHTGFPVIWGQSLKGVLRSAFENSGFEEGVVHSIFGPLTNRASDHAGAISVGDARILLFPVRSVKGVFAYVTSPFVLRRFVEDLRRAYKENGNQFDPSILANIEIPEGHAKIVVDSNEHLNVVEETVVLEDIPLTVETVEELNGIVGKIRELLPDEIKNGFEKRLIIVSDDLFSMLVRTTTEIVTRIRINSNTGTVDTGALWYEEFLPSDTLMYSVIVMGDGKKKNGNSEENPLTAEKLMEEFKNFIEKKEFLQIGGDETVGKGFVRISPLEVGRNEEHRA